MIYNKNVYEPILKRKYSTFPAKDSTLDLDFINNRQRVAGVYGAVLDGVTFTRSTTATYFGADGTLQTAAINKPRFEYDPVSLRPLGLLIEGARANILLNSDAGVTQSVTVSATVYTLSFYGTGTVTLSGSSTAGPLVGTGDNTRVTLTFTPTAGTLTLTVSGTVTKWQLEAGAFATSYIPTTASSATRGADVASMTGANFSSWFNTSGVFVVQADWISATNAALLNAQGPTISDRHQIKSDNPIAATVTSGTIVSEFYYDPFSALLSKNIAYQYADNNFVLAQNGIITNTDTSGNVPTNIQTLEIGQWAFAGIYLNGHIQRITNYKPLPNHILQYITRLTA